MLRSSSASLGGGFVLSISSRVRLVYTTWLNRRDSTLSRHQITVGAKHPGQTSMLYSSTAAPRGPDKSGVPRRHHHPSRARSSANRCGALFSRSRMLRAEQPCLSTSAPNRPHGVHEIAPTGRSLGGGVVLAQDLGRQDPVQIAVCRAAAGAEAPLPDGTAQAANAARTP